MFWVHLEIVTQQMRQTREQTIICKVEGTEVCALCMCLSTYIVGWNLQMIVLEIMKRFALALLHLAALVQRLFFIDIWCSFCNTFVSSFSLMFFVFFLDINIEQIALNYTCLMSDLCSQWEGFIALYWPIGGCVMSDQVPLSGQFLCLPHLLAAKCPSPFGPLWNSFN